MISIKNVGWAVGKFCNANCRQCYSKEVRNTCITLTKEDVICVLDKLENFGIRTINLGGNEPIFTHGFEIDSSILPFIIREIKNRKMILGITTNGTSLLLLNKFFPEEYEMVDDWDISIDSPFPNEHDTNRNKELFNVAEQALKIAQKSHKKCSIIYCLMNWNCTNRHVFGLAELSNRYDVDLRINLLKPTNSTLNELKPSNNQIYEFFTTLDDYYVVKHSNELSAVTDRSNIVSNCPCGIHSFAISGKKENGSIPITPCVYMQKFAVGNLLKDSIESLLNTPIFKLYKDHHIINNAKCHELFCKNIETCRGGCLSYAILTNQNDLIDDRCPIINQKKYNITFNDVVESNIEHVHSNYLCTWIGGLS